MIATSHRIRRTYHRLGPSQTPVELPVRRLRPRCRAQLPARKHAVPFDVLCVTVFYRVVSSTLAVLLWPFYRYADVRSFILAHGKGFVGAEVVGQRYRSCVACAFLLAYKGEEYCNGENEGRGCNCGHYPLSRLTWKLKLRAWSCPQGHFGAER